MMGINNPIAAYWFDETAGWFGNWVEAMLSQRDSVTNKPLYRLDQLLGILPE